MGFREKIIIFAVLPWILALLALFVITIPGINGTFVKFTESMAKQSELDKLEVNLKEQKNVRELNNTISQYEDELKGFNKKFPENDDLETLYVDLQAALNKTDLTLQKLALSKIKAYKLPKTFWEDVANEESGSKGDKKGKKSKKKKKKKAKKGEKQLPPLSISTRTIKLDTTGDYKGVIELLYYLNNYYRFLALKNISIKTGSKLSATGVFDPKNLKTTITFDVMNVKKNIIVPEKDEETDKKKAKKSDSGESTDKPANDNTEKPKNEE